MNRTDADIAPLDRIEAMIRARAHLQPSGEWFPKSPEAEGGCGVTGFACTVPVRGKHIYEPSIQMRNRGNGKGGGIAACGLAPEDLGVSRDVLEEHYLLQVALLDPGAREEDAAPFIAFDELTNPCRDVAANIHDRNAGIHPDELTRPTDRARRNRGLT